MASTAPRPLSCLPMDHDAAHKYLYGLPEVAADRLRLVPHVC